MKVHEQVLGPSCCGFPWSQQSRPPGTHLDQVYFAGPHEVEWEPIKGAVMPVTIGSARRGAGVQDALEQALLADAETHMTNSRATLHLTPEYP